MARARLLHSKIVQNKALNDLSCDTSRLAFTWLISFADREGRTYGDPAMLCSMLFPRRRDVSIEDMEGYLREWHANKLIIWYKRDGDLWISFPKFLDLQTGQPVNGGFQGYGQGSRYVKARHSLSGDNH